MKIKRDYRAEYARECKHYLEMSGMCALKSQSIRGVCHISIGCNADCRRMKRWDKLNKKDTKK